MTTATGPTPITNTADYIDSRDVIARIDYLREIEAELDSDEREELTALVALAEEASGYAEDWRYGATLIRDSYFEEYARELAEDIGALGNKDIPWPANHIDWEAACDELKQDYTEVDFDGVAYWIR